MFELRVLSGLHLGAALPLFGDQWLIGQADEADLMLSDARVAARACELRREESQWLAQPESGEAFTVNIEAPFQVADVWLCVARIDTPWAACLPPATPPAPEASPEAEPQSAPAVAVAARKGIFTRSIRALSWSLMLLLTLTVTSWVLQPTVAQTQVASSTPQSTPAELQAPLQKMLRERDLAKVVKLDMHNQRLRLTGRLSKSQMQIYNRMLERFNATYTSATPLDNQVKLLKVSLPFRIVQITTGSRANIVTDDGQRLFVGDEVDHLRLVAITSDQIEFNGRDNIKVSW